MLIEIYDKIKKDMTNSLNNTEIVIEDNDVKNSKSYLRIQLVSVEESFATKLYNKKSNDYLVQLRFKVVSGGSNRVQANCQLLNLLAYFIKNEDYEITYSDDRDKEIPFFYLITTCELFTKDLPKKGIVKEPLIIKKSIIN